MEANAQQLIAPEAVEAIPELEFDQTANLEAQHGMIGWWLMRVGMRMQSRFRNWSLIRRQT